MKTFMALVIIMLLLVSNELHNTNKILYSDNRKAVKFWSKQQNDKNMLILHGFNSHEADEFIVHGCMDYYQYTTNKENK